MMLTNCFGGICYPLIARFLSFTQRISWMFLSCAITMSLVVILAIFKNDSFGYWVSFTALFLQGFLGSMIMNSLINLAGKLDQSINGIFWTCTALSGLVMSLMKVIFLVSLGEDDTES